MTYDGSLPNVDIDVLVHVLVSLDPEAYPFSTPPQLQLLDKYLGPYGVDAPLFGSVLRTYISHEGVEFVPGTVCVFDGVQNVLERCAGWYNERLTVDSVGELVREEDRRQSHVGQGDLDGAFDTPEPPRASDIRVPSSSLPAGVLIHEAEAIIDRKSSFVRLCHPQCVSF